MRILRGGNMVYIAYMYGIPKVYNVQYVEEIN